MSYHSLFYTYQKQSPWTGEGGPNLAFSLIVAMTEMGISGRQIRSFLSKYHQTHPVPDLVKGNIEEGEISKDNWKNYLGKKEAYLAFTHFYEKLVNQEPETIKDYFADLVDGLYTNGFHSLIRLAYAFESGQKEEVVRALAFLSASYKPLHFQLPERETKVFYDQIIGLKAKKANYPLQEGDLYDRICQIAERENYLKDFAKLEEENLNIYTLRALAIRLCREIDNEAMKDLFCAVHAFRIIVSLLPNINLAVQQFYMVMQATYLALACPDLKEAESGLEKNWPFIFQLSGVSQIPAHVCFIYSCYREYQFAPSTIYPEMAYGIIHSEIKLDR